MSVKQDLMQKLDALVKKHRGTRYLAEVQGEDIPVLTEVIEITETQPAPELSEPLQTRADVATQAPPTETHLAEQPIANAVLSDAEVEVLARDIFQRVMTDLGDHISNDLRTHIADRLSSIIDKTVTTALDDFKQELSDIIGDAIADVLLTRAERIAAKQKNNQSDNESPAK